MRQALLVGLGGFFGAMARYGVGRQVVQLIPQAGLPYHTILVNLIR